MLFFILCSVIYRSAEDNNWIYCLIFLFGIINKSKVYQNLEALIKVIVTDNSERWKYHAKEKSKEQVCNHIVIATLNNI